jgi:hypothetical protein
MRAGSGNQQRKAAGSHFIRSDLGSAALVLGPANQAPRKLPPFFRLDRFIRVL